MATYLTIPGPCYYSDFRLRALETTLGAKAVRALWVHYVHLEGPSPGDEREVLQRLLTYGDQPEADDTYYQHLLATLSDTPPPAVANTQILYVTPREGTTSPWSTKATNIAASCHLGGCVKRIEWGRIISITWDGPNAQDGIAFADALHDRMSQVISREPPKLDLMFAIDDPSVPPPTKIQSDSMAGAENLEQLNAAYGLGLQAGEIDYLKQTFSPNGTVPRAPTHVELYMFAQINSEHCRHKTFNADWTVDGAKKDASLFGMIKSTHKANPQFTVSAYSDNAAVFQGEPGSYWAPRSSDAGPREWVERQGEKVEILGKVETHNHPTAVSPFPGAATGSGGEIRDEGAVGRGSRPKTGLAGFAVSDLLIPGHHKAWEHEIGRPNHIASSFQIMIDAPLGSARYSNEFGRPCTAGYFRTFQQRVASPSTISETAPGSVESWRGYHKPIMVAGGVGTVRPLNALKDAKTIVPGAWIVVLGGPAMLVGMGGAALSSVTSGHSDPEMDYSSVQRADAEMERRAQMVIDACCALPGTRHGAVNPIQLIHDVGAGGLSVAIPELLHDAELGGELELRTIARTGKMTALQIWCCEAQERYVMIVNDADRQTFEEIAVRERCPYSMCGRTVGGTGEQKLVVTDRFNPARHPIDLPLSVLFGRSSKKSMNVKSKPPHLSHFDTSLATYLPQPPTHGLLGEAVQRVLTLPAVGSKSFLITIGDRTVGGLTARDQMVGPWQVPVADVSVTATSLQLGVRTGEAMAMGERPILALISPAASARMAVAEALTNLAAADVKDGLRRVKLSANWMAASARDGEAAALYEAVQAVSELCPQLGVSVPVGKDSMSMSMAWTDGALQTKREIAAPISAVITAFTVVADISRTWTPTLRRVEDVGETVLLLVDLAQGRKSTGGSALAQVFSQIGDSTPDVHNVLVLADFFDSLQRLREANIVLAYHDRSDGGLLTTLVEMMFAGRCGLDIHLDGSATTGDVSTAAIIETLFNEELGAVFQVRRADEARFRALFPSLPSSSILNIGHVTPLSSSPQALTICSSSTTTTPIYQSTRSDLQSLWSHTSHVMQRARDRPSCADAEHALITSDSLPGLSYNLTFIPSLSSSSSLSPSSLPSRIPPSLSPPKRPLVAILREQGVNGHAEMAFAFHTAGFAAIDVHMTDLLSPTSAPSSIDLAHFTGLAACGGFSYGDCLSAGQGWAMSVLHNARLRTMFQRFFERTDTFTLGVCNGCQFLGKVKELIPGTEGWPVWEGNVSEQYEARVCMVEICDEVTSARAAATAATESAATTTRKERAADPTDPAASVSAEGGRKQEGEKKEEERGREGGYATSVFFRHMAGSTFPVAVAHGEGRAAFKDSLSSSASTAYAQPSSSTAQASSAAATREAMTALRYVHPATLRPTTQYPFNPNGSPAGIAGVKSRDGRVLALMPHPERAVLVDCASWIPDDERTRWATEGNGKGPWGKMFEGVREWVGA